MQTGFGMAGVGRLPTSSLMLGVASAESMCREIEQLVQMEDSPNLYAALAAMPKPVIDPETAMTEEGSLLAVLGQVLDQERADEPVHDRTRAIAKRMDSN